jgi:hypothetical protein
LNSARAGGTFEVATSREGAKLTGNRSRSVRLAAALAAGAVLLLAGSGSAGLLQPQPIDANTGDDALEVGAAFGNKQAWAGFEQPATGAIKLYVAHAQDGVFAPAQPVDTVTSAALAGNRNGDAVVVYTKKVGAVSTLFGRRLSGGQTGPELQISADAQNVNLLRVHRIRQVAENDAGVAAVCYVDSAFGELWAAVLKPTDASWTRYGPLTSKDCSDIAVDTAGDVIVLGQDNANVATTDRIVGGRLQLGEQVDPAAKDEPSLAVWGNSALVLARVSPNGGAFTADAWTLQDIEAGGPYHGLGHVSPADWDPNGNYNVEFAKAAVAANGKGIVTFRLGNPGTQTSLDYYEPFDAGATTPLGQPQKLAGESKLADVTPVVDASGNGMAAWADQNGAASDQHIRALAAGGQDFILAGSDLNATTSFEADAAGDFLAVVEHGSNPVHVAAFFADLAKPTVAPTSSIPTPVVTKPVVLHSGAADSFASVDPSAVHWHFPEGSIIGPLDLTGLDVTVTPATVGPVRVRLTATDKGRNTGTGQLVVRFTAHVKLKVSPAKVKKRGRFKLTGKGFASDKAVSLALLKGSKIKARLGFGLPNGNGGFTTRLRLSKKVRGGRYLVRACQVNCRIKATALLRVK